MSIVADSSFLVSLYTQDAHSATATGWLQRCGSEITISSFTVLEVHHAHRARIFRRIAPEWETERALAAFDADRRSSLYRELPLPESIWGTAGKLVPQHTPLIGARSIDILHVAFALAINAEIFLTFDRTQARLAQSEGLQVPLGIS